MPIAPDKVFPWGRSLDEYVRMFDLSAADLQSSILDCGGGPASFNAELSQRGGRVVSCDPIYEFSAHEIEQRIEETCGAILNATYENRENFVWREIRSVEHLERLRRGSMREFLADFPSGLRQRRYLVAELPTLPFQDGQFDLALCSHLLFTYCEALSLEFHLAAIRELCRVAREARIFPLLPSFGEGHSPHLDGVLKGIGNGYSCEIKRVLYEFQKGGNEMLRVCRKR